jgi:hypothetical protein
MITWNYRVFREDDGDYVIREVFYSEDGAILGCTANAVEPYGSTLEELAQTLADFQSALALPILTVHDIPQQTTVPERKRGSHSISSEQLRAKLGLNTVHDKSFRSPSKKAS